jgi:hypothetical protein
MKFSLSKFLIHIVVAVAGLEGEEKREGELIVQSCLSLDVHIGFWKKICEKNCLFVDKNVGQHNVVNFDALRASLSHTSKSTRKRPNHFQLWQQL